MTDFVEVKTQDLSGAALDWAVAKVVGVEADYLLPFIIDENNQPVVVLNKAKWLEDEEPMAIWSPSTDWAQGGPLIESNQVFIEPPHDVHRANYDEKTGKVRGCWQTYESWHATVSARVRTLPPKIEGLPGRVGRGEGETALIAACRAIVASHFGDTVSVPKELCHE